MPNRLIDEPSAYLQQHADNPINWWPWGEAAFNKARLLDRPVLLSVGYATCHWCHVMAAESFQDPQMAAFLNEHFVAIKVDRQQHPDVDAAYMQATQALTGVAGWPMTVFVTPEGIPFFAGNYFPPVAKPGQPSFRQVCEVIAHAWNERRNEVVADAKLILSHLASPSTAQTPLNLWQAIGTVVQDFDPVNGGFGSAPKFPSSTVIDALLVKGDPHSLDLAQRTLEAMARGGIHDQIGGGFHRYATDAGWVMPHFEKMLYDNGLLLGSYIRGWRRTAEHSPAQRALFEYVAYQIVFFLSRELRTSRGAFMAGVDADSCDIRGAVHEGIFYLWNQELLADALGNEDADWAEKTFHVSRTGTFEDGLSTLQLRGRIDFSRLAQVAAQLLKHREQRFHPAIDRQIIAAWNGWTIDSLIWGAMIFRERNWLDLAIEASNYLWEVHWDGDRLARTSTDGILGTAGVAEDYGAVSLAFARLAGVLGEPEWLTRAELIIDRAIDLFSAPDGGFFDAESGLFLRPRSFTEVSAPSGSSTLISALRLVGALSGRTDLLTKADLGAATLRSTLATTPRFAGAALEDAIISDEAGRGLERAVVVIITDDPMDKLACAAWRLAPPGTVILAGRRETIGFADHFSSRSTNGAYICRGTVCFDPVTDYIQLKDQLWRRC